MMIIAPPDPAEVDDWILVLNVKNQPHSPLAICLNVVRYRTQNKNSCPVAHGQI